MPRKGRPGVCFRPLKYLFKDVIRDFRFWVTLFGPPSTGTQYFKIGFSQGYCRCELMLGFFQSIADVVSKIAKMSQNSWHLQKNGDFSMQVVTEAWSFF